MSALRTVFHGSRIATQRVGALLFTAIARLRLALAGVRTGPGFRATGWIHLRIHPTATVSFGRDCRINSGAAVNLVGSGQRTGIYAGRGARIQVGDRVGISGTVLVATESIEIGSDTLLGGGCLVVDSDLHALPLRAHTEAADPRLPSSRPVQIGSRVFLGAHSIVLKGARIGDGAVVGAGSVVPGAVDPGAIVAGPSARPIRPSP